MPAPNVFAGGLLDRAAHRRPDADWLAERLEDPTSRAVVATADGVLTQGDAPALVALAAALASAGAGEPVFLGQAEDGAALFAVDLDAACPDALAGLAPDAAIAGLRELALRLPEADAGLVAYAAAELNWQRLHRFCSTCGGPTRSADGGHMRECLRCGRQHHPRTDPVVIMLVVDGDRILMGRGPAFPPGVYSALAGFVEPGETLEAAVARELREEAGIEVDDITYCSSQPWPFPTTLMLGFRARWVAGEPEARDDELEDVRWFHRDELLGVRGSEVLPGRVAIARRLVDDWLQGG